MAEWRCKASKKSKTQCDLLLHPRFDFDGAFPLLIGPFLLFLIAGKCNYCNCLNFTSKRVGTDLGVARHKGGHRVLVGLLVVQSETAPNHMYQRGSISQLLAPHYSETPACCLWCSLLPTVQQLLITAVRPLLQGCLFDDLSVWELYIGMHVVLHYTWLLSRSLGPWLVLVGWMVHVAGLSR